MNDDLPKPAKRRFDVAKVAGSARNLRPIDGRVFAARRGDAAPPDAGRRSG